MHDAVHPAHLTRAHGQAKTFAAQGDFIGGGPAFAAGPAHGLVHLLAHSLLLAGHRTPQLGQQRAGRIDNVAIRIQGPLDGPGQGVEGAHLDGGLAPLRVALAFGQEVLAQAVQFRRHRSDVDQVGAVQAHRRGLVQQ